MNDRGKNPIEIDVSNQAGALLADGLADAARADDFSFLHYAVGISQDPALACACVGKFLMHMQDGQTVEGHQRLYEAVAAEPERADLLKSYVVWLAVQGACWRNMEPLFDWAKSKPEFEAPHYVMLNALAEKADNRSLVKKIIGAGTKIDLAIGAAQTNERPTKPAALALLQDWQASFAPVMHRPKGFNL